MDWGTIEHSKSNNHTTTSRAAWVPAGKRHHVTIGQPTLSLAFFSFSFRQGRHVCGDPHRANASHCIAWDNSTIGFCLFFSFFFVGFGAWRGMNGIGPLINNSSSILSFFFPLCQNKGAVGGIFGIGVGGYQAGMNGERGGRHTEEDGVHHWMKKGWKGLAWHGTAYLGQVGWERVMRNHSGSGKQESSSSTIPPFALIPPFFLFLSTSSFLVMTWNIFFSQQSFQSLQFKP